MQFLSALVAVALAFSGANAATYQYPSSTAISLTAAANATIAPSTTLTVTQPLAHSAYAYTVIATSTAIGYSYYYSSLFDTATVVSGTAVAAGSGQANQVILSALTCSLCNSGVSTTAAYTWDQILVVRPVSTSQVTGTAQFGLFTDSSISIVSGANTALAPLSTDTNSYQPGKMFYYAVTDGTSASAGTGNATNVTLTVTSAVAKVNPFASLTVVGNSKCPKVPTTTDSVTRRTFAITGTTMNATTTYNLPNSAIGTYWVYLAPTTAVAAGTTPSALGAESYINVAFVPQTNSCVAATGTTGNGFCSSVATLKSVGVAVAGVMAAAFMLF